MKKLLYGILAVLFVLLPAAFAVDYNQVISAQDQATFDLILSPVMKVYNFIKYAASVIAVLFLVFAGVTFITSGDDQAARSQAKKMAGYVIVGLGVIWIAPYVIQYLVA